MSRIKNVKKNVTFGYIGHIATILMSFATRTVFINTLGATYLGVSGLFANILGVLSFAELGIGAAMTFALYKPVSENDIEKLNSLMLFYKIAYRWIATIITILGLAVLPFLNYIVKDPGSIGDIKVYYILFLVSTVASYFVTYKYTLINAYQKKYIITNITTLFNIGLNIVNIVFLYVYHNYLIYLIILVLSQILQNIFINIYINRMYPFLKNKKINKLTKEELAPIKKNIFALIWYKIANVSIRQTDSIIISAFIGVTMVGLISNYNLLLKSVLAFIAVAVSAIIGSLGNLMATESKKKQYQSYKVYNFVLNWVYGFCAIAFLVLATPFITLWIGTEMTIPEITWFVIVFDFYLQGNIMAILEVKSACGIFVQDKWIVVSLAVINLVVSIIMVKLIGITGVFVGTICQRLVAFALRPRIVFKYAFNMGVKGFYLDSLKYFIPIAVSASICMLFRNNFLFDISWLNLFVNAFIVLLVPNLLFFILFRKSTEFIQLKKMIFKK